MLNHVHDSVVVKTASETASHLVTDEVDARLKEIHLSAQELLRLFWTMFPITSTEKLTKLKKIKSSLDKFRQLTLGAAKMDAGMMESIPKNVLEQIDDQIKVAIDKFKSMPRVVPI